MAKQNHFFKQSPKTSLSGSTSHNLSQIIRTDGWYAKIWNKVRGKGV